MIIGIDGSRAFGKDRTGTENYSLYLLKALAKIDSKNDYRIFIRPGVKVRDDWPDNFKFLIVNFKFLWTQGGLALETFKDVLHPSKMDALFVPAHTLPIIRRPGLKTVVTVHDLGSEYLPSMHQVKQRLYLSFMQKHQLKTADKIIAVSNATKKDLIKKIGIEQDKIKVIYEGSDKKLFRPIKNDIEINRLKQFYLFVGTVQPRKNLERVLRAFTVFLSLRAMYQNGTWRGNLINKQIASSQTPRNDNIKLVIAGSKGWLSDEIYKLPEKLGIEDRVKFLGYVPDEKLPALYSAAIALVFPSLFEGFGLPILEAQACGCPVITSNISSMPEVAGKGAIYVNPYNIDDIVRGMEKCQISNVKFQMIRAGFENIKRFSWEKAAKETLGVLEEVANI